MKMKAGDMVRYLGADQGQVSWGNCDDPRDLLVVGQLYQVTRVEVHTWHTKISLANYPGKQFNSVCFEEMA